jgi:sporulation protein YlmC with PRC-barrel domain
MLMDLDEIIDIIVQTEQGQELGRVDGAILDIESHAIHQYIVKPSGITHLFDKHELLISVEQVISISKEKMIVYDSVEPEPEKKHEQKSKPQLQTEAIATQASK